MNLALITLNYFISSYFRIISMIFSLALSKVIDQRDTDDKIKFLSADSLGIKIAFD
jgi:hypothetical protein